MIEATPHFMSFGKTTPFGQIRESKFLRGICAKKQLTSFRICAILDFTKALRGTAHFAGAFFREPLSPAESSGKKPRDAHTTP
ncbi:hypothetical protein [uncultured Ruminococcus sp.]|uniref:hypothetical protein n=1 Tax=uncultured Ruminococcus sp. TaxID=165186 RepID=UPI00266DB8DB|nr:hypothetical protein [uncultured Ruminococcus sp.]